MASKLGYDWSIQIMWPQYWSQIGCWPFKELGSFFGVFQSYRNKNVILGGKTQLCHLSLLFPIDSSLTSVYKVVSLLLFSSCPLGIFFTLGHFSLTRTTPWQAFHRYCCCCHQLLLMRLQLLYQFSTAAWWEFPHDL